MSTTSRIAGLTFIPAGVVGITQFHYVVSHLSQIATGATAIGLGVAVWGGHSVMGKVKLRNEERKAKRESVEQGKQWNAEQLAQLFDMASHELPPTRPTQTWEPKRVIDLGRVER